MYISSLSSNGYKCTFVRRFDARIERVHLSSVLLKVLITFILLFVFSCVRLYFFSCVVLYEIICIKVACHAPVKIYSFTRNLFRVCSGAGQYLDNAPGRGHYLDIALPWVKFA